MSFSLLFSLSRVLLETKTSSTFLNKLFRFLPIPPKNQSKWLETVAALPLPPPATAALAVRLSPFCACLGSRPSTALFDTRESPLLTLVPQALAHLATNHHYELRVHFDDHGSNSLCYLIIIKNLQKNQYDQLKKTKQKQHLIPNLSTTTRGTATILPPLSRSRFSVFHGGRIGQDRLHERWGITILESRSLILESASY